MKDTISGFFFWLGMVGMSFLVGTFFRMTQENAFLILDLLLMIGISFMAIKVKEFELCFKTILLWFLKLAIAYVASMIINVGMFDVFQIICLGRFAKPKKI